MGKEAGSDEGFASQEDEQIARHTSALIPQSPFLDSIGNGR
jgi:hypothetical protein